MLAHLTLFVERHDDDGRSVPFDFLGLLEKVFFAFFQRDGIDDAFALRAFQARFDHGKIRRVNAQRHTSNVGLRREQIDELGHHGDTVDHTFVHVQVEHLRARFHLSFGYLQSGVELILLEQTEKLSASSHVTSFADVDKVRVTRYAEGLETCKCPRLRNRHAAHDRPTAEKHVFGVKTGWWCAWWISMDACSHGSDERRQCSPLDRTLQTLT